MTDYNLQQTNLAGGKPMANRSSHPLLSCTDGIATGMTDTLLLVGRLLIAAVFLMTVTDRRAERRLSQVHQLYLPPNS